MRHKWIKYSILSTSLTLPFAINFISCSNTKNEKIEFLGSNLVDGIRHENDITITYKNFKLVNAKYQIKDFLLAEVVSETLQGLKAEIVPTSDDNFDVKVVLDKNYDLPSQRYFLNLIIYNQISFKSLFNQILMFDVTGDIVLPSDMGVVEASRFDDKFVGVCPGFVIKNSTEPKRFGIKLLYASENLGDVYLDYFVTSTQNGDYCFDLYIRTSVKTLDDMDLNYVVLYIPGYEKTLFIITLKPNTLSFEEDSWKNINMWANEGLETLKDRYKVDTFVGLKKPIVLNNFTYEAMIIGEEHDDLSDFPNKKASLTFMLQSLYGTDAGTPTLTNYGYVDPITRETRWRDSILRKESGKIKLLIDQSMGCEVGQSYIKLVDKKTGVGKESSTELEITSDALWCMSATEMGIGPNHTFCQEEGWCYSYFKNILSPDPNIRREFSYFDGQNYAYWTRSTSSLSNQDAVMVKQDGALVAENISLFCAMLICFCI